MFQGPLTKLGDAQEKYPFAFLSVAVLITIFLGFFALQLQTDANFDNMFGDNSDTQTLKKLLSNEFGSTDRMFILVQINDNIDELDYVRDVRDPSVLIAMDQLKSSLVQEQSIPEAFSVADFYLIQYGRFPTSLEESISMFNALQFDTSRFVNDDFSVSNIVVNTDIASKPGSLEESLALVNDKVNTASKPLGVDFTITGEPTLVNRIIELLIGDNLRTVGIAVVAIFAILSLFYRSIVFGFIATTPVVLTLTWLAGTLVLMDLRVTMMTASVGAMMVGMGVDYSIHMTHGYRDNIRKNVPHVTRRSVIAVGGALVASFLTTLGGFGAMLFGSAPSSIMQGTALSIGITFAFFTTVFFLPPLLVIHRKLFYTDLDSIILRIKDPKKATNFWRPVLDKLAGIQISRAKFSLAAFILLTIVMIPGLTLIRLDTEPNQWIPDGDPVIEKLDELEFNFGGLQFQNFLIEIDNTGVDNLLDLRDPKILRKIAEVDASLESLSFVDDVQSPTDQIKFANRGNIPKDIENVKNILDANPQISSSFNKDFTLMKMVAVSDSFGNVQGATGDIRENYNEMLREFETVQMPEGVRAYGQGNEAQWIELDKILQQDVARTAGLGFLFVFTIASLLFRSPLVGFLAIIPILLSIILTVGFMGYIGLPFNILTSGMLAIVMGIGIDFSIHIIHKTKLGLAEGKTIRDSIGYMMSSTGEAISLSTLTTVIGFSALFFATLVGTQRLGYSLAIAIIAAFIACIVIVPAMLVIEYNFKNRSRSPKTA